MCRTDGFRHSGHAVSPHKNIHVSLEKKLEYVNYWIFKYTENYYISPKVQEIIEADDSLKELCRDNNGNPNLGYVTAMDVMFPREEIKPECITNLLLKDYSL